MVAVSFFPGSAGIGAAGTDGDAMRRVSEMSRCCAGSAPSLPADSGGMFSAFKKSSAQTIFLPQDIALHSRV
jgi:hypothetical protein